MGASACAANLALIARTFDYPAPLSCERLGPEVRPDADSPAEVWRTWASRYSVPGGQVHATAIPIVVDGQPLGFLVLVHDLSFVERREATTRQFLAMAFGFLAVAASIVTLVAGRLSWRGWSNELRRLIRGERPPPEFRPFLRDVRDLVDHLASEREADGQGGLWTPQRLKNTLTRHLHGERVVLVANREPYIHERTEAGAVTFVHPASGLVTALEPVMRACSGVWIAHGSGTADREAVDAPDRMSRPAERGVLHAAARVAHQGRGEGLLLRLLQRGPLAPLPYRPRRPLFERGLATLPGASTRSSPTPSARRCDPTIRSSSSRTTTSRSLPRMIRERLPRATVLTFWHIPWPNSEQFGICPWREELLRRAPRQQHPRLPHRSSTATTSSTASTASSSRASTASRHASSCSGRPTLVRPYPISIEWPSRWLKARRPSPSAARASSPSSASRPTRCSAWASIASTTRRASRSGCWRSSGCSSALPQLRGPLHLRAAGGASRTAIERYRQLADERRADRRPHQPALRRRRLPADHPAAGAPRAARRSSATTAPRTSAT